LRGYSFAFIPDQSKILEDREHPFYSMSMGYAEGGSKIGILTRRLLKIFRLERVTIANGQGTSEDKNFDAKQNAVKNQFLNHVRYKLFSLPDQV